MHEASVALDLVQLALEVAAEHGARRVTHLTVRVGEWSSVVPEALAFAFPECARATIAERARLSIERVPGMARCARCGPVRLDLALGLRCPRCGAPTPEFLSGAELELDTLEFE